MLFSVNTCFLAIVFSILFCSPSNARTFAGDHDEQPATDAREIYPVITLDKETQQNSGMQILEIQAARHQSEFIVFGNAVNIQPLLMLRHRYLQALTEIKSANAKFSQSEQSIKRLRDLYHNGIAAKRSLQEKQSQWQADQSQVDSARYQMRAIIDEAQINWGKRLTGWMTDATADKLEPFLSGEQTLLLITLPPNRQLAEDIQTIFVEPSGNRATAQAARLISPAPQIDYAVQGNKYFFQTPGETIRTGMNVSAWIPERKEAAAGAIIPKSAVIWSMDQSFVYVKTGDERFRRRMVSTLVPTAEGYFVGDSIKAGEFIVITGGQMLFSEELRGQIPDDND